jgi:OmcA/MtrC family decaheme c-type cytochrome
VTYPGVLNNCEQCHLPGTYDFSGSAYTANNGALMSQLLLSTAASGTVNSSISISPYVVAGSNYGGTDAANNLVTSPIAAACVACHDSTTARAHMAANGGSFYTPRSTAINNIEQCLLCHGTGKVADIKAVHMK